MLVTMIHKNSTASNQDHVGQEQEKQANEDLIMYVFKQEPLYLIRWITIEVYLVF